MSGSSLWLAKTKNLKLRLIRELLESGLETKHQHTESFGQALRSLAEIGEQAGATGPVDLSRNIDKYLYEED